MKFMQININLKKILFQTGFLLTLILFFYNISYSQIDTTAINNTIIDKDTIIFKQIISDTLFDSNQIISLIYIPKKTKKYTIRFVYDSTQLIPTSKFAVKNKAIAAINGGFFDMDKGGSVTYFETHDSIISKNVSKNNKWGKSSNLLNGIVILTKNDSVIIEKAKQQRYYELSNNEYQALITGPVLLLNSESVEMPDKKFVTKRHPRTCLCKTNNFIVFVTVDGRQKNAQGMNLYELQEFLESINCIDAVNLDGGGSTTMYLKDKGIVNFPSDKTGERPVSNALIISKN